VLKRSKLIWKKNNLKLVGLINNAGYAQIGPMEIQTREKLTRQLDVNLVSHMIVTKAFLPLLREGTSADYQSRILLISSGLGRITFPFSSGAYAVAKHGLESLGDCLRRELAAFNIKVVVIEPGEMDTNFKQAVSVVRKTIFTDDDKKTLGEHVFNYYLTNFENWFKNFDKKKTPVTCITDQIESSLLDSEPFTRYHGGNDVKYFVPVADLLPDAVQDLLMKKKISDYTGNK